MSDELKTIKELSRELFNELYDPDIVKHLLSKPSILEELSMGKEPKDAPIFEAKGREVKEVHFGQAIQIGTTAISNINVAHTAHAAKLESKIIYSDLGVEFRFDGKDCLVPISVIKLVIFA
jgi:hypothetical protein